MIPSIHGPPSFVFFAISVWIAFLIGDLHTEIANVTKTDFGLDDPFDYGPPSFVFFAISVWIAFSGRSFTHGDRKGH